MDIIDDMIALHQDIDIYGMRMAASFLASDYDAMLETARRMIWVIRFDLENRARLGEVRMSPQEIASAIRLLNSIVGGLDDVRNQGLTASYKLDDLGEQAELLARQLDAALAGN